LPLAATVPCEPAGPQEYIEVMRVPFEVDANGDAAVRMPAGACLHEPEAWSPVCQRGGL
jgi:hypothetical protein